jgi:hypothetical protein
MPGLRERRSPCAPVRDPDMTKPFPTYPGSKDASGVAERIISLMPKHETYVEMCVGGGAVFRKKIPAHWSILVLHDTRFVGEGFRERERIKRKRDRWRRRFAAMPPAERQVIAEALRAVGA